MGSEPIVDGRTREEILDQARRLAVAYTDGWDPERDDAGVALLRIFASMTADVVDRLDAVPERYRRSFFETLGFDRRPPRSARLPLTFAVADELDRNVAISEGTRAVAPAAVERPETFFEVVEGSGFDATPANLAAVYSVRPETDHLGDHTVAVDGGDSAELFGGDNHQTHALYLAHDDLFSGSPPAVRVDLETEAKPRLLREALQWEFYGERDIDGEPTEGWHPVGVSVGSGSADDTTVGDNSIVSVTVTLADEAEGGEASAWTFTEARLADVVEEVTDAVESGTAPTLPAAATAETLWLRCRYRRPTHDWATAPVDLFDVSVDGIALVVGDEDISFEPDELLADTVPLSTDSILPFGSVPRHSSTFFVRSERAFTKPKATVALNFVGEGVTDDSGVTPDLRLSWEYWDGDSWSNLRVTEDGTNLLQNEEGEVRFEVPQDLAATTVSGQEGHWIRVRLVGGAYVTPTTVPKNATGEKVTDISDAVSWETVYAGTPPTFSEVSLSFGDGTGTSESGTATGIPADTPTYAVSYNNRQFDTDVTRPFVGPPDTVQTLYLGFDAPLNDGPIQVLFSVADREFPGTFHPRIRWEYETDADRGEWSQLPSTDESDGLIRRGIVGFVFPEATRASAHFGHDLHWIRARIDGSQFGLPLTGESASPLSISHIDAVDEYIELTNREETRLDLSGYQVDFEYAQPEEQLQRFPDGTTLGSGETLGIVAYKYSVQEAPDKYSPVQDAPGIIQFERDHPVINDYTPDTIAVLDPTGRPIAVRTDDLDHTTRSRLRETPTPEAEQHLPEQPGATVVDPCEDAVQWGPTSATVEPCDRVLQTRPLTADVSDAPPVVTGVYANATWAANVRTVTRETLGGSDGTPSQSFDVATTPVFEEAVWVDESESLSERGRAALRADPTVDTTTRGSDSSTLWVRWTRVERLFGTGADARVYVVDPTEGTVTFGDGVDGSIPPRGRENVEITYQTGGGAAGNAPPGGVDGLVSSVAFVDEVTNPEAGDGGADTERVEDVLKRAPRELRDRGRAVTAADFERLARAASRRVARVRCLTAMDDAGAFAPGWVTLVVVPESSRPKPTPSAELRRLLRTAFGETAPTTLVPPESGSSASESAPATPDTSVGDDSTPPGELVIRGPTYVDTTVTTVVVRTPGTSVSTLEERLRDELAAYFHPLTGGDDEDGWAFGALPCLSDVYSRLERTDGVDRVETLTLTFEENDASVTVSEGDPTPDVSRDVLVTSGAHSVTVTGGQS